MLLLGVCCAAAAAAAVCLEKGDQQEQHLGLHWGFNIMIRMRAIVKRRQGKRTSAAQEQKPPSSLSKITASVSPRPQNA